MAIDVSAAGAQRWLVTLDRPDLVGSVRDYFRRLGLAADVSGSLSVELLTDDPEQQVEDYAASWVEVNDAWLKLEQVEAIEEVEEVDEVGEVEHVQAPAPLLVSTPAGIGQPRLGELLVTKGFISEEQLARALTEARSENELLGVVLLRNEWIFEEELARTLSERLSIPYISVMRCGVNPRAARRLPYEAGMRAAAIPVREQNGTVLVAFADPTDSGALAAVRVYLSHFDVAVAELSDIKVAWRGISGAQARA